MRSLIDMISIGEICKISAGQGAPQGEDNYCNNGTPFVKAGNLERLCSGQSELDIQQVNETIAKSHKLVKYPRGSIVFAKSGMSCLKGHLYMLKHDCYIVSHLAILQPNDNVVDRNYLMYALRFKHPMILAKDASFPSIKLSDISSFRIPYFPFNDQKRIVEILDKEFARIDALKANAEKSLKNAQELFETELSSILNGGSRDTEILRLCSKVSNIKWNEEQGQRNYVDLSSVSRDTFQIEETQQIFASNAPSRAKQIIHDGDIIFGTTRPTLKRLCVVPEDYDKQICSTGFAVIRPQKEKVVSKWIFFNLLSKDFYSYIEPIQRGATYPAVSDKDVKQFKIWLPELNQQKTILASLERLEKNCKKLQSNCEKTIALCDDLKQSLLRKAFNGEL